MAIAILLARLITGYTVLERAVKSTGIDWWLGSEDDPLFQKKARLEVSGILKGTTGQVLGRVGQKKEQSRQSDASELQAYIIVVEFSRPLSRVAKR